ncbi:MAG: SpoIIE family protein phosphatase [Thermoanaerobaculia bacterium]
MSRPSASLERDLSWEDVLGAARLREGESAFLVRLLQLLCESRGLKAAALYSGSDECFERQVMWGSEAFPASIDGDDSGGYESLELPEGRLLFASGEEDWKRPKGPIVLALAAGLRAAVLRRQLKEQSFVVNYRGVELEALYEVGLAIASMLNLEQLGEEILLRAVSLLDARRGALYLRSGGRLVLDHTLGGDAMPELPLDDPQVAQVLGPGLGGEQYLLPGARHLMAVPVGGEPNSRGILLIADKESRHGVGPFPESDRRTLALFANQAATALETAYLHRQALEKERLEREIELAADIQRRLLPTAFPVVEGFELAGWSRPARHVGGDFYDLMRLKQGRVGAVLADVSGKGLPAALMVSTIHSALRLLVDREGVGPGLVQHLNRHIAASTAPNKFITLLVVELDPSSNEVRYVNAGHNPGVVIGSDGNVRELASGGLPLGLFGESSYESGSLVLEPGDLLCLYSDGLTECESPSDEEFGLPRLVDLLRASSDRSLSEVIRAVDAAVTDFAQGLSQGDDQTLVLLRRTA